MMEDAKRFLRFITPGMIFGVELCLLLFLSARCAFLSKAKAYILTAQLGGGIAFLLVAGGIGYLFSLVHHFLYWTVYKYFNRMWVDHLEVLEASVKMGKLTLHLLGTSQELPSNLRLTKGGSWRTLNAIWHTRKESSDIIKGAEPRSDTLMDIVHADGAGLIASVAAIIGWGLLHPCFLTPSLSWKLWIILTGIGVVTTHLLTYVNAVGHAKGFINIVVTMELEDIIHQTEQPLRVVVSKKDVREEHSHRSFWHRLITILSKRWPPSAGE